MGDVEFIGEREKERMNEMEKKGTDKKEIGQKAGHCGVFICKLNTRTHIHKKRNNNVDVEEVKRHCK